jgi:hypothetical protein
MCRKLSKELLVWAEETNRRGLVLNRTANDIYSVLAGQMEDRGVKGWLYRKYVKHRDGNALLGKSHHDIRLKDALPKVAGIKRVYHSDFDSSVDVDLPMRKRVSKSHLFFSSDEEEDAD